MAELDEISRVQRHFSDVYHVPPSKFPSCTDASRFTTGYKVAPGDS